MKHHTVWVGLDVGAHETSLCALDRKGEVQRQSCCRSDTSSVLAELKGFRKSRIKKVALEAGSTGTHLSRKLIADGYPVTLFETRRTSRFLATRRNKTDTNDARGLAELARVGCGSVSEVHLKTLEVQQVRTRLRLRHALIQQRVKLQGWVRSLLRLYGRTIAPKQVARAAVEEAARAVLRDEGIDLRAELEPLLKMLEDLELYISALEVALTKYAEEETVCRRFMAIPGVGAITALSFYTVVEDPGRFRRVTDVGPYLGLAPRISQSGLTLRRRGISKMGNGMTRSHLVMAAHNMLFTSKANDHLRQWAIALRERTDTGRARTALARKLAVVMLSIWKSGQMYSSTKLRAG